jgi:2-keto-3-deoxy-L-rhamnonate aldolase RhmA
MLTALRGGETVLGTLVFLSDPASVEIAAAAGYDFCWLDMEHSVLGPPEIAAHIRAAEASNITPLVRVPALDRTAIRRSLDAGARGIVVPAVSTAAHAEQVVDATYYPPRGSRGVCSVTRSSHYGQRRSTFADHIGEQDDSVLVVGLIEDEAGVENVREILDQGVHIVQVGQTDLAASLGLAGHPEHPRVLEAVAHVVTEAAQHRSGWAGASIGPGATGDWLADCRVLTYSVDVAELYNALATAGKQIRSELSRRSKETP